MEEYFKAMFTLYRIAFAPARKPYRIRLLFTHENGDFGANFCNGANLRRADLDSGASHIGKVLCHTLVQCERVFGNK